MGMTEPALYESDRAVIDRLLAGTGLGLTFPELAAVGTVWFGQELFPWIMAIILLVVCVEGVLANRFYRETGNRVATPLHA